MRKALMFIARTSTLAASALLLLSLAACTSGGSTGDGGGGDGGGGAADGGSGAAAGDCLTNRTWVLDLDDAASQLGESLSSNGMNVTQAEAEGRQDFRFDDDGTATAHIDVTYTITIDTDGLVMTLVQTHAGDTGGAWEREGDDITFSDWDNAGYSVQNQFIINGTASENSMTIPSEDLGDGSVMSTDCAGDALTTTVTGSPFTHHWTAEG